MHTNIIKLIKDYEYVSISKIQRELPCGFVEGRRIFETLLSLGLVFEESTIKGNKVKNDKIKEILQNDESTLSVILDERLARREWLTKELDK